MNTRRLGWFLAAVLLAAPACGGGDSGQQPTPVTSAQAATGPESVFKPVAGYRYVDVPDAWRQLAEGFRSVASVNATGVSMRSVIRIDEPVGVVIVMELPVDPKAEVAPGARDRALAELGAGVQARSRFFEQTELAGQPVVYAEANEPGPLSEAYYWFKGLGLLVQVRGDDQAKLEAFTTALIRANG